jgi:chromosome segregation ATPase
MRKDELNPNGGKELTPSATSLTPQGRKEQTTKLVEAKIHALSNALKSRARDRFHGLPRSLQAFLEWPGEGDEEPLKVIPRPTLNSRKDLKEKVQKILQERKNTPEEDVAKHEARIKELERQIKGLASANHEMHLEIGRLETELSLRDKKIEKLESSLVLSSSNVSRITRGKR